MTLNMKSILLSFLSCSIALCSFAQKLSESFNPLIKETSQALKIIHHPDGNYLVHGDIDYYGNVACGSLIKVDQQGKLLQDFQKVYTDREINKVIVLPSGKILIHGPFTWLNGQRVGRVALLNADGSVDQTFQTDTHATITNVVVQSTGKIVTVISEGGNVYPEMQRLNSDGSRDYSFSPTNTGYIWDRDTSVKTTKFIFPTIILFADLCPTVSLITHTYLLMILTGQ